MSMKMGPYETLEKLGSGAFGTVHLVKSNLDKTKYVIKHIKLPQDDKDQRKTRTEVAILEELSHPNIVAFKEFFEEAGYMYIVMEYCEDGDLGQEISKNFQQKTKFSEDQILRWFFQMCLAIEYLHDNKIIHRDIKPENIFLSKGNIKLGDFGFSKKLPYKTTLTDSAVGTRCYQSPEVAARDYYNQKSDIWSLGCVLYELCTLKYAFTSASMRELIQSKGKHADVNFSSVRKRYSVELSDVLTHLLEYNQGDRYSIDKVLKTDILKNYSKSYTPNTGLDDLDSDLEQLFVTKGKPRKQSNEDLTSTTVQPPTSQSAGYASFATESAISSIRRTAKAGQGTPDFVQSSRSQSLGYASGIESAISSIERTGTDATSAQYENRYSASDFIDVLQKFESPEGSGLIDVDELRFVLTNIGDKLSEEDFNELITDEKKVGDKINYEEFVRRVMSKDEEV